MVENLFQQHNIMRSGAVVQSIMCTTSASIDLPNNLRDDDENY